MSDRQIPNPATARTTGDQARKLEARDMFINVINQVAHLIRLAIVLAFVQL